MVDLVKNRVIFSEWRCEGFSTLDQMIEVARVKKVELVPRVEGGVMKAVVDSCSIELVGIACNCWEVNSI